MTLEDKLIEDLEQAFLASLRLCQTALSHVSRQRKIDSAQRIIRLLRNTATEAEKELQDEVAGSEKPRPQPQCCNCHKPIKGRVYYQGGSPVHPCHKRCLVVIRRSRDGGI